MKGALGKKHIAEQAKQINLKLQVSIAMKNQNTSMRQLSLFMGQRKGFMSENMKKKDHHISLLIALSRHLQTNLLEHYLPLLPDNLRPTKKEKELQQQVADLQKKILDLEKERDWLKSVVGK